MTTEELRGIVLKQFYDRPEPPPLPFRSHPSPRLRQIKGGGLQSHQASRVQEFLMGGEGRDLPRQGQPAIKGQVRDRHEKGGFKWSSQHGLCELFGGTG